MSNGYVTAHIVTRLDEFRPGDAGRQRLGGHPIVRRGFDALGNPTSVAVTRDDGASHKTTLTYDEFALVTTSARIDATNADGTTLAVKRLRLRAIRSRSTRSGHRSKWHPASEQLIRALVLSKVTPPGGAEGVLASRTYQGFAAGESGGRRVIKKLLTDPVAPANVATTAGRTNTAFFDSLGRILRNEMNSGADYANQTLIVGQRTYDFMGRVAFEADPFPASQSFQTAYGTTYYFNADGTPSCSIRGSGVQAATATTVDEINEIYPTCFGISFGNSTVQVSLHDAI